MIISKIRLLILILTLTFVNTSYGQLLTALHRHENTGYLVTGFYKNAPLLSVGGAKAVHIKIGKIYNEYVTLFVDLTSESNFHSNNNLKFTYGGQGYIFKNHVFKILVRKTFTVTRLITNTNRATYVGGELEFLPGIYKQKYFIATHFYFGDSFSGHVVNKGKVGTDIETGWVKPHLGTLMTGINGGYYIRKNLCLYFDIDFYILRSKKAISGFPLVSEYVGINYIF